jgi:hypothetical protein
VVIGELLVALVEVFRRFTQARGGTVRAANLTRSTPAFDPA